MTIGNRSGLIAFLIVLCFSASVVADQLEDGLAAYDQGDYSTALQLLCPLADQGDAHA